MTSADRTYEQRAYQAHKKEVDPLTPDSLLL